MNLKPDKTIFTETEHAELRAEVKALVGPDLSQADIGRQVEIPGSTLSQYLNGRYQGDNNAVATTLTKWVKSRIKDRELQRRLPKAPLYQPLKTSAEIALALAYARQAGRMVAICGSPGVSKTSTAIQFKHEAPGRVWLATMDPSTRGVNTCLVEILGAMGEPDARGTPQSLARSVVHRVMEADSLIIVDEAQHLSDQSVEQLRAINDKVRALGGKVGIALMGNLLAYSRMAHDGSRPAFSQVSSRMAQRMYLMKPDPTDVEMLAKAWAETNNEILTPAAMAYCKEIAAKPGGLRNVEMTMESALMAAWGVETPMDVEHLRWAFNSLSGLDRAA